MSQDRRSFLVGIGAAALAASCRGIFAKTNPAKPSRLSRIGIQLYTLRRQAATDLAGVLSRLSAIGYKEVEFAGYYNHSATEVRDMLRANGITSPSAHIAIESIERDPAKVFADAKTIGHEWITVPSLPRGKHETAADWKRVAAQFNAAATQAKAAGFRFAFHNHNDIVKRTETVLPIDILMAETDPSLVSYQMDIYWAVSGGANPLELLAKYPGRFAMFHIKDGKPPFTDASQTDVGQGQIDFRPILAAAPGITHYFVESDSAADPLAFAANSYKYLSMMEF
jgi:sugar phosphate isomerase/epimerase